MTTPPPFPFAPSFGLSIFSFASFASVQFSGQAGGRGHQPIAVVLVLQLPLLHPGDAGDEDLQRHPSVHCQTDGRGSAAHFGGGQKSSPMAAGGEGEGGDPHFGFSKPEGNLPGCVSEPVGAPVPAH